MFNITDETRNAAIAEMAEIIGKVDIDALSQEETDKVLGEAFDAAVAIVKKQFGF